MKENVIIDNYRDLPIGKYMEICDLCDAEMDDVDRRVAIVAILTGLTENEVLHLPLDKFASYARRTAFLEHECPENMIPAIAKSYPVGDYVLIPANDIRKITTAQYVDFQTFSEDKEHRHVELLSVFLVPKGCDYNEGYDIYDVQDAIRREMSVAQVLSLLAFFFGKWFDLIKATRTSLRREAKRVKDPAKREALMKEITRLEDSLTAGAGLQM